MTTYKFQNSLDNPYLDTLTSRIIRATVKLARTDHLPMAIMGAPGVGKSFTFSQLALEDSNIIIIEADSTNKTTKKFLGEVASACGLYSGTRDSRDLLHMLISALYGDQNCLLVIDEAQNLDLETMRTMLKIWEKTDVPVAFVGNPGVLKRTKVKHVDFAQIVSRVEYKEYFTHVFAEDITAFGIHYNVEFEAHPDLQKFGANKTLRDIRRLLEKARILAGPSGPVRVRHLKEALSFHQREDDDRGLFKLVPRSKREENVA